MLKRVIFLGILQEITDLMVFILISFFDNDRKLNISPLKKRACWKNTEKMPKSWRMKWWACCLRLNHCYGSFDNLPGM